MTEALLRLAVAAAGIVLLGACQGVPSVAATGTTTTIGDTTVETSGSVSIEGAYVE